MKIRCIFRINLLLAIFPSQEPFKHANENFLKYLTIKDVIKLTQAAGYPLSSRCSDYVYILILP
jgi:hypothetical protein